MLFSLSCGVGRHRHPTENLRTREHRDAVLTSAKGREGGGKGGRKTGRGREGRREGGERRKRGREERGGKKERDRKVSRGKGENYSETRAPMELGTGPSQREGFVNI